MKIMSFGLAKMQQLESVADVTSCLNDMSERDASHTADTTQPDDDVYITDTCRTAESAGNGEVPSGEKNFSVHKTYMNFLRPRKRASETALYPLRGSLLSENGTNATPFSSDVYNNSTRAKKRLAGVSLYGRSMVEMLGVLAIIGVLSVGAIAGYQKAMFKYKLNKQSQQISAVLNSNFIYGEHFKPLPAVLGSPSNYPLIPFYKKLEQIPLEMINKNYENEIFDIFGNMIYVLYINRVFDSYIETSIMLSQKEYLQCVNVLTVLKEFHGNLYDMFVYRQFSDSSGNDFVSKMAGDTLCTNNPYSNPCLKDLTLADMEKMCNVCSETESCRLGIRHHYK